MKYIDAEKLKAEIKKRLKNIRDYIDGAGMKYKGPKFYKARGKESAYDALLSIITSLQQEQPEVDFEEEWDKFEDWMESYNRGDYPTCYSPKQIARHFFELGLSAGMEKSNGVDGVVHHALKSHWIVTDKNKLAAILKAFPEGAEVELFICAKKEK